MFPVLGQYLPYFIELEHGWTWYSKYVAKELNLLTGLATFHVSRLFPFRSTVWQCDVTVWQNASVTYQVSTQPAPHVSTYLWDFGFIDEKIMIMYFLFSQFTVLDKNYFLRLLQYHCICMKYVKSQFDSDQFEGCADLSHWWSLVWDSQPGFKNLPNKSQDNLPHGITATLVWMRLSSVSDMNKAH